MSLKKWLSTVYRTFKDNVFRNDLGYAICRALKRGVIRNDSIYAACRALKIPYPDIPVRSIELYSQCGEDIIVRALLLSIAARKNIDLNKKKYIEIGANHPFATSATYLLSKSIGMSGVLVEANIELLDNLNKGRPNDKIIYGAVQDKDVDHVMFSISNFNEISSIDRTFVNNWNNGKVGERTYREVPAFRINDIFKNYTNGDDVAYLSIDVEGMDIFLLRDMDFKSYRPWIVQAEPSDHHIPGNSCSIIDFMKSMNYTLTALTEVNLIFVDELI